MSSWRFLSSMTIAIGVVVSGAFLCERPSTGTVPSRQSIEDGADASQQRKPSLGDSNDAAQDALRYAAWDSATELHRDPCNHAAKQRYIEAVTAYVRAWNAIAPCLATRTCGPFDQWRIAASARSFRTAFDARVSEAMADAHSHTVFQVHDFPGDVVVNVAGLTHDPNLAAGLPTLIRRGEQCS